MIKKILYSVVILMLSMATASAEFELDLIRIENIEIMAKSKSTAKAKEKALMAAKREAIKEALRIEIEDETRIDVIMKELKGSEELYIYKVEIVGEKQSEKTYEGTFTIDVIKKKVEAFTPEKKITMPDIMVLFMVEKINDVQYIQKILNETDKTYTLQASSVDILQVLFENITTGKLEKFLKEYNFNIDKKDGYWIVRQEK